MVLSFQGFIQILHEMIIQAREIEGGGTRLKTLIICLIIIGVINSKDISKVCVPVLLNIGLLFTPYLYIYLYQDTSFKRFFWSLPEGIMVAYTLIIIISKIPKNAFKSIALIISTIVLISTGNCIYSAEAGYYKKAENLVQVDRSIVALSEAILSIDSEPTCIIPYQAVEMIRVANPDIQQIAGRNYFGYMGYPDPLVDKLISNVSSVYPDSEYVFSVANTKRMKFVVTMSYSEIDETVCSKYGYGFVEIIEDFKIYYNPTPGPCTAEWYITQYGPDLGQNYFYTIEDTEGHLVIVDGGHYGNVGRLERVIRDHDYHVDAWIFTTLSDYHYGAAYRVLSNDLSLITVDRIYIPQYTDRMINVIRTNQADWEVPRLEMIDEFVGFVASMDNVTYVDAGSDYDLIGLNMHIYHHWDNAVEAIGSRESSNGSMVFSVSGNNDSMLFTADVTLPFEDTIIGTIGDAQFDYITANDHGNWTFSEQWYDSMNPRGIFIDEYSSALAPGGQAFSFYSYCLEKGYNIYTFQSVPNRITLR